MNPKVSVIVPVYNKAFRVAECLQSILSQDCQDYELLIIDDGSTDGSDTICRRFAKKYPDKTHYFRKNNGGVSSARNFGIGYAAGEYICFIDADDTVKPDYISTLVNATGDYDIVTSSNDSNKIWKDTDIAAYVDTEGRSMIGTAVWGKLYKKRTITDNNIKFNEDVHFGEDTLFNLLIWSKVCSIKSIICRSYIYFCDNRRRYQLSQDEIKRQIDMLMDGYKVIGMKYNYDFSIERDINITLSLFPLSHIIIDDTEYKNLYKYFYPESTELTFLNDPRCSPIFRVIGEASTIYQEDGLYGLYEVYKKIATRYRGELSNIKYPFRCHKLLGLMLKNRLYSVAALISFLHIHLR